MEQDFQKIGNLTERLTKSVSVKDTPLTKSTGPQAALQTIGKGTANSKKIGTELSTIGSVRTLLAGQSENGAKASPGEATRAIRALLNSQPELSEELAQMVFDSCMPLTGQQAAMEMAKLDAVTKRRQEDDVDTTLLISAYGEKLAEYPADVVRYVLNNVANQSVFFPAWAELYEDLEFWARDRLEIRDKVMINYNDYETDHRP